MKKKSIPKTTNSAPGDPVLHYRQWYQTPYANCVL